LFLSNSFIHWNDCTDPYCILILLLYFGNQITESFDGHQESVSFLEFWPDGRLLISRSYDEKQRVWDVSSVLGNPLSSSTTIRGDGIGSGDGAGMTDGAVKSTVLSLDEQAGDGSEDPRDSDSDSLLKHAHISIAVSPDGRYVAASSTDDPILDGRYVAPSYFIRLWDLRQSCSSAGERQPLVPIERLNGHANRVDCLTFAKNGRFLVSASIDNDMRVWDVGHLGIAPAPESPSSPSPKGAENTNPAKNDRLVTGGRGKQKSRCTMRLVGQSLPPKAIAVSPDGRLVASGAWTQGIMFWDLGLSSAEDSSSLHGESSTMNTAAVTRDMEVVCRLERTGGGNIVEVKSVDLSPVGNMLAAAYADGQVMICMFSFSLVRMSLYTDLLGHDREVQICLMRICSTRVD
jgi:WD40 repeat protein